MADPADWRTRSSCTCTLLTRYPANANILFPHRRPGQKHGDGAFEIVICGAAQGTQYQALLLNVVLPFNYSVAAEGAAKDTVGAALGNLLEITAFLMERMRDSTFRNIWPHHKLEHGGGAVDSTLFGGRM